MIRILVISSRDLDKGSTKFRIAQYQELLSDHDIQLEYTRQNAVNRTTIKQLHNFDVVFNQKCLINTLLARKIIRNSKHTLFDFDDAIYTRTGTPYRWPVSMKVRRRLHLWLRKADLVTTSSRFLADYACRFSSKVTVVPMGVNTQLWRPRNEKRHDGLSIGWAGAPVNLHNLERIEPVLESILDKYPFVTLAVFSGKKPELRCRFEYHPFRPGAEAEFIANLDIGLLPLPEDEFTLGKSPIKAIQYLACAVPVIGEIRGGAPAEILDSSNSIAVSSEQEWQDGLDKLISDSEYRQSLGMAGRRQVAEKHDRNIISDQICTLISNLATVR